MSSSTPDISSDDYLTVLVCSANVGNAEPTPASFAAWVPNDGQIQDPLHNTRYPVTQDEIRHSVGPYSNNNNNVNQDEVVESLKKRSTTTQSSSTGKKKQFDIIVLGMQEAAFVNKKNPKQNLQKEELLDVSIDSSSRMEDATTTATPTSSSHPSSHHANNNSEHCDTTNNHHPNNHKKGKGFNPLKKGAKKAANVGIMVRGVGANKTYRRDSTTKQLTVDVLSYDTKQINNLIKTRCPSYETVTSCLRGEMRLFILAHQSIANDISNVYIGAENTGIGSIMANKGGIIVTLTLGNMTRLSFMTCHLEAHEGMNHYTNRNKNLAEILNGAKTDPCYNMQDATIISHHMFLCGDLNYRIKFSEYEAKEKKNKGIGGGVKKVLRKRMSFKGGGAITAPGSPKRGTSGGSCEKVEEVEVELNNKNEVGGVDSPIKTTIGLGGGDEQQAAAAAGPPAGEKKDEPANGSHFDQAKALVEAEDWKALNGGDELASALKRKECLVGFSTLPCHWPPTFKVARGEGYQYNEKRTPSYTDRILWKSAEGLTNNVIPFLYEPCPEFITSDHKPIRGAFAVKLNKCRPSSKLGLFDSVITHDGTESDPVEKNIQILVSDMKCTDLPIMDNELIGGLSDPYVKFVSSPKALLYSNFTWPKSSTINKTLNPVWKENYHLTMDGRGMKNGLAEGAMLMLTVVDYDATSSNDVIGTVALNLNELVSDLDLSGRGPPGKVQETHISKPILRNGQEYGMLECNLKTAFLAPKEYKSFLSGAKNVKTATKISWKSKMNVFTGLTIR